MRNDHDLDASVRLITIYDIRTDGFITHIDVLVGADRLENGSWRLGMKGEQIKSALTTGPTGKSNLMVPPKGLDGAYTFRIKATDLAAELRSLADLIDDRTKAPAGPASPDALTDPLQHQKS